jgi:hypothetical protein
MLLGEQGFAELDGDDVMPRFRLPRITWTGRGDGTPGEEHERLVLLAQIAGFVVVFAGIAAFVLFAATNGPSAAPANPPVPTITDAGGAATTTTTEPEAVLPPVTTTTNEKAAVAKPRPKPKPTTSSSGKPTTAPDPRPGDGDQVGVPGDSCSPEGARAVTPRFHLPVVCHDGSWRVLSGGPGRPGGHDGGHRHGR